MDYYFAQGRQCRPNLCATGQGRRRCRRRCGTQPTCPCLGQRGARSRLPHGLYNPTPRDKNANMFGVQLRPTMLTVPRWSPRSRTYVPRQSITRSSPRAAPVRQKLSISWPVISARKMPSAWSVYTGDNPAMLAEDVAAFQRRIGPPPGVRAANGLRHSDRPDGNQEKQ